MNRRPRAILPPALCELGVLLLLAGVTAFSLHGCVAESQPRVLVVGWGGATWRIIDPLLRAGRLPHLAALIERGQTAELESIRPPVSAAAWTSLATGHTPGETGVASALYADSQAFEVHPNDARTVMTPFVWQQLEGSGVRSFVFGAPLAAPASELDGVLVAGAPVLSEGSWTQPPQLATELRERGILSDPQGFVTTNEFTIASFQSQLAKKREFLLEHMEHEPWDLGWIMFEELEQLHRMCWPGPHEKDLIEAYVALDALLGELVAIAGPTAEVLVVSEHGTRIYDEAFGLNAMMYHEGFCAIRGPWQMFEPQANVSLLENRNAEYVHRLSNLEFQLTRAIAADCAGNFGSVRLALEGMEAWSMVPVENRETIFADVESRLREQFSPYTLEPVTRNVERTETLYPGSQLERIADIVFELDERFLVTNDMLLSKFRKLDPTVTAAELRGIFVAAGPSFEPQAERGTRSILEVAPTVLTRLKSPN